MATLIKKTMADGSTRWQAVIRRGGTQRKKTCRTQVAATRWARKLETAIDDGRDVPTNRDTRRTVSEVLDRYSDEALDDLRTAEKLRSQLEWWKARLGDQPVSRLVKEDIRVALAALENGATLSGRPASPATRRRYLAALRAALTWAVDRELVRENVARGAARKGRDVEPAGRVRFLTDDERETLFAACANQPNRLLLPLVQLAVLTGARQGELLALRWPDVDLDRGLASLAVTKNGRPRSIALSSPAVDILRRLATVRALGTDYIFGRPGRPGAPAFPRDAFEAAVESAGLPDFRFHDLRHTFASYLLSAGATLAELAAALGHRTLAMVQRYAHLEQPHAARLAERVAQRVGGPTGAGHRPWTDRAGKSR